MSMIRLLAFALPLCLTQDSLSAREAAVAPQGISGKVPGTGKQQLQRGKKPAMSEAKRKKLEALRSGKSTNRYYAGDRQLAREQAALANNPFLKEERLRKLKPKALTPEEKAEITQKHGIQPENIGRYGNYKPTDKELNDTIGTWRQKRGQEYSEDYFARKQAAHKASKPEQELTEAQKMRQKIFGKSKNAAPHTINPASVAPAR